MPKKFFQDEILPRKIFRAFFREIWGKNNNPLVRDFSKKEERSMNNAKEKLQRFIDINGKDALVVAKQENKNGITICTEFSQAMDAEKPEQLEGFRILKAGTLMEIYIMQDYVLSEKA